MTVVVGKKPKAIRVRYKGADTLRHTGRAAKFSDAYFFAGGTPVEVSAVPLRAMLGRDGKTVTNYRPLPPTDENADAWDIADIELFEESAKRNPEIWEVVK